MVPSLVALKLAHMACSADATSPYSSSTVTYSVVDSNSGTPHIVPPRGAPAAHCHSRCPCVIDDDSKLRGTTAPGLSSGEPPVVECTLQHDFHETCEYNLGTRAIDGHVC